MVALSSIGSMILRARARLRVSVFLGGCFLVLLSVGTTAAAPSSHLKTATASGARLSAHLTKKSFTSAEAKKVKLVYRFSSPSKSFSYLLTFKKGAKWLKVKNVKHKGYFKGSHAMTVKKVFAGKPVKVGRYRLKLSADGGRKLLSFKVVRGPSGSGSTPTGSKPVNTVLSAISGAKTQGQTLSSSNGSWSHSPTSYSYQWRRCNTSGASCAHISDATSSSYTLVLADVGSTIRVVVTASNSYGSASATSSQTAVVTGLPPANTALPTISGTTTQGQTLSSSNGFWSNSPTSYSYQWRRCNSSGVSCAHISGASASSYTLVGADFGSTIRVVVTASNSYGSANTTSAQTAVVATVPAVSASDLHSCALSSTGTVKCWGDNRSGELGDGPTSQSSTPVPVKGVGGVGTLSNVTQISAGGSHTCALLTDHTVECWGYNGGGQLGNGTTTQSATPVQVKDVTGTGPLSNVTQISAGSFYSCALSSSGTVCWGVNGKGQLGNGTYDSSSTPVQVEDVAGTGTLSDVTQISTSDASDPSDASHVSDAHTCALLTGGAVN
jgi:hypothetical protein